jgi:hypothetical protein
VRAANGWARPEVLKFENELKTVLKLISSESDILVLKIFEIKYGTEGFELRNIFSY